MDITTPQLLYHGTTSNNIDSFSRQLLHSNYWRPGKDFGEGFYTTISIAQARRWAHKTAKEAWDGGKPCVLVVELTSLPPNVEPLLFLSDSPAWASFVYNHRKASTKGIDPCDSHPDIIIGPMADNDTGKIVHKGLQLNKNDEWFYDQIVRSQKGRKLDALKLGNQVVFASERWESHLALVGYHIYAGGRWIYGDASDASETKSV
ncbi:DUF3990 domain-containing protein [Paenibacillus sp. GSMTC-2017]|uniref:DUF3990 domain-containing protein n=1 Tax=Paenibacillus sp. GSMTC-2017 TaxID=2794350 RepID=UPI0018D8CD3A|nr:DUF3990 domain-containing protein [Paenibacillus sp. GSMTC-2017]MBH5318242.1 DUF3990 domain-containing protein [Paenibacillus sp. GSMTC-2017]